MKAWLFIALVCVAPSIGFAGSGGSSGGGSFEKMEQFRLLGNFQSTLEASRKSLQQVLQSLTDEEAAQVIPPSLGKKLMTELVGNVEYRQYIRSNTKDQDYLRDGSRTFLRDPSGVIHSAISEKHKVSPVELKAFVDKGHSLEEQEMKEKLSPIVFDTELMVQQLASSSDSRSKLMTLVYYMHLGQMDLKLEDVYRHTGALADLLQRRAENKK